MLPSGAEANFLTDCWCGGKNCEVIPEKTQTQINGAGETFQGGRLRKCCDQPENELQTAQGGELATTKHAVLPLRGRGSGVKK